MMKIVVIGGTGLIGSQLVTHLRDAGHEVVVGSPSTGVNTITGEGLAAAMTGADVVVDVANSPSFEDDAVMNFFTTASKNIITAEVEAGVKHHIALSVVGTERLPSSGYFRAKLEQEALIKAAPVPYTILRATQFFEFLAAIVYGSPNDDKSVRLTPAAIQPVSSADVAATLADLVSAAPINGTVELAGPKRYKLDDIVSRAMKAAGDNRQVISDPAAAYFGQVLDDATLTPGPNPRLGKIAFEDWKR